MAKSQVPVWLTGTAIVVALGAGAVGGAMWGQNNARGTQLDANTAKIVAMYQTIDSQYYEQPNAKKLTDGAINGMLASLKDPYSTYLQTDSKAQLDDTISASFGGIGATLRSENQKLYIDSFTQDSPAKKAGLKVDDQVTAINGKSTAKLSVTDAVKKVRGDIGTKVTLTIKRNGAAKTLTVTRAKITTDTVNGELDATNKTVGIISISTFSDPTAKQFESTVKKLRKQGAKRFVLDLRGNPGGMMDRALQISSMFLKNGQIIMQVQPRTGDKTVYKASKKLDKGFKVTEPTAVLIDGNTASASEITAAALHDNRNVPLVGEKSFGKGTVQTVNQLNEASELKLTVAKWLTPKGQWIHHQGLTPTIEVDYPAYANTPVISAKRLDTNSTGSDVRALQQSLAALGYNPGEVNGSYTAATQKAVTAFQKAAQLPETGISDQATIDMVTKALAGKVAANDNMTKQAIAAVLKIK
ncbi:S41 family peptidase [Lacticaseibacillus saniviri]|uniref:Periplasmic protease n=1 Tax=Lacticaseibacillus saniviri JCM 17471 = DSM 24301 TaxID=1293598 RepID=A0A0R2N5C0_9LACO|nr:S41 family peptidase [Lacticaseibacillus saniviri]KRO18266.1 periplasmic protease [Lacticaseibacillus saniviri JCM 17471 = DSM 24301]MCG4280782.1 S41 family peptidase [Lacticaseibacillus saniviri]